MLVFAHPFDMGTVLVRSSPLSCTRCLPPHSHAVDTALVQVELSRHAGWGPRDGVIYLLSETALDGREAITEIFGIARAANYTNVTARCVLSPLTEGRVASR